MLLHSIIARYLSAKTLRLQDYGLEGLVEGKPTTLYHGTTRNFRKFDLSKSREDLVNQYYGAGIFLTPSKRVAEAYADANRNIGFPPEIIEDLKRKNPNAGSFLQTLFDHGREGWEIYWKENGFWRDDPLPGQGAVDLEGFEDHLGGIDSNDIGDLSDYIIGTKGKPKGDEGPVNIFNQSTGAPSWLYDLLDKLGLDSDQYRPKVYTVEVTAERTLVTSSKAQARKARQQGYDAVIYYGTDLVQNVPEVALFDPRNIRITRVEVV